MTSGTAPRWVRLWFRGAAIYGILALVPIYFQPMPTMGQAFHYGFVGSALAFQLAFWVIGGDPARYRALMPVAVCEKLAFGVPVLLLYASGLVGAVTAGAAGLDLVIGAGFLIAWRATPPT